MSGSPCAASFCENEQFPCRMKTWDNFGQYKAFRSRPCNSHAKHGSTARRSLSRLVSAVAWFASTPSACQWLLASVDEWPVTPFKVITESEDSEPEPTGLGQPAGRRASKEPSPCNSSKLSRSVFLIPCLYLPLSQCAPCATKHKIGQARPRNLLFSFSLDSQ